MVERDSDYSSTSPARLQRRRAADRIRQNLLSSDNLQDASQETLQKTLHQLQVHQIELEMQNEELRKTHLQLDHARARYFNLYDLAPVGYCTISEDGLILEANIAAATLLGLARSALIGKRITQFIIKADQDIFYLQRQQLLNSDASQSCELRMMKPDGTLYWAHFAATIENDIDGVPGLRLVMSDITGRKMTEEAMRYSEERYRNLFNSIDEGFCVVEMIFDSRKKPVDYIFMEVNAAFEKHSGLQNATGKHIMELVPDFDTYWIELYGKVLLSGEPVRVTHEEKIMDRWFDVFAFRIGEINNYKVAILFNDITERKHIEAERAMLDKVLQEKNADLEYSMAVAEKANRAKSDFLSSMSHELRSPLNAILGFAQLIESGTPSPTVLQKRSVEQILKAGWYLLDLINEVLDLALIESGKLSLSLEPISLIDVLRECETMIELQAHQHSIQTIFPQLNLPYFVFADRTRLKQILINLLSNAIKYNRSGGTVQVTYSIDVPGRIRLSVADSGAGLTPENIKQLFQPFHRLGQESNNIEGTGIGLVVCKQLIELMQGKIGLESTVGKGSVFWIELNLTDQPSAILANEITTMASIQRYKDGPVFTLLYVEDNPANVMLIEDLIQRRPDIRLLTARDGDRGIEMARVSQPDIIVMDINLPGINGIDALKILADDVSTKHIPVVALSANAMPSDIEKGLQAGFFRYLTKPIKVFEFMQTLDVALEFASKNSLNPIEEQSL